jgi:hypothetical protein
MQMTNQDIIQTTATYNLSNQQYFAEVRRDQAEKWSLWIIHRHGAIGSLLLEISEKSSLDELTAEIGENHQELEDHFPHIQPLLDAMRSQVDPDFRALQEKTKTVDFLVPETGNKIKLSLKPADLEEDFWIITAQVGPKSFTGAGDTRKDALKDFCHWNPSIAAIVKPALLTFIQSKG